MHDRLRILVGPSLVRFSTVEVDIWELWPFVTHWEGERHKNARSNQLVFVPRFACGSLSFASKLPPNRAKVASLVFQHEATKNSTVVSLARLTSFNSITSLIRWAFLLLRCWQDRAIGRCSGWFRHFCCSCKWPLPRTTIVATTPTVRLCRRPRQLLAFRCVANNPRKPINKSKKSHKNKKSHSNASKATKNCEKPSRNTKTTKPSTKN